MNYHTIFYIIKFDTATAKLCFIEFSNGFN